MTAEPSTVAIACQGDGSHTAFADGEAAADAFLERRTAQRS
ncbi:hypothetical protein [Natrarchaeobaculum sulfurireducens]|nr:hypothetical protein [Natrarchaeobaculum sulfurireducens]